MTSNAFTRWRLGVLLSKTLHPFRAAGEPHVHVKYHERDLSRIGVTVRAGESLLIHRSLYAPGKTPHALLQEIVDLDAERLLMLADDLGAVTLSPGGELAAQVSLADLQKFTG